MNTTIARASALALLLIASTSFATPSDPSLYPLSACIVSGEEFAGQAAPALISHEGREIRFCCSDCVKDFEGDPEAYVAALDAAIIATQRATYPSEVCVVSGEKLGSMGDPVEKVVGNRLVRLCCESCLDDLEADPAAYIAKLDAAVVAVQSAAYPADHCPISGGKLGGMGEPDDYVFAGQLVRFCCGGCVDKFNADPSTALAKIYGDVAAEGVAPAAGKAAPAGDVHSGHDHSGHDHSGHGHGSH